MVGVIIITAGLIKRNGINRMLSRLLQRYDLQKSLGRNILLPKDESIGITVKRERAYGVCLKLTEMPSMDLQKRMGNLSF
jgi:hypothetical protein